MVQMKSESIDCLAGHLLNLANAKFYFMKESYGS